MTGSYKSTYQILLDIAKVWDEIGDMQKAEILETVAGKTRATAAAAILESPELLEQAYADAMKNAAGAGERAVNTSLESIEKRVNIMKNDLRQLAIETLESKSVANIVDTIDDIINKIRGTELSSTITALTDLLNLALKVISIAPVGGLFGAILTGKNAFGKDSALNKKGISILNSKFGFNFSEAIISKSDLAIIKECTSSVETQAEKFVNLKESLTSLSPEARRYVTTQMRMTENMDDVAKGAEQAATATKGLAIAQGLLNAALSIGISLIVSTAIQLVSKLIHAEEEARKELAETLRTAKENTKQLAEQTEKIDGYIAKYNEYISIIKDEKSSDEDLYTARSNLYDLQKDVIEQFDVTAKGVDFVNGAYKEQLKILQDINTEQRATYLGENASAYSKAKKSESKRDSYLDLGSSPEILLSEILKAYGYNESSLSASEFKNIINEVVTKLNDENLDTIQSKLASLLDFNNDVWKQAGRYPGNDNSAAEWFKEIVETWNEAVNSEDSIFNNALNSQEIIKEYEKTLTQNDSRYSATYKALEDALAAMEEARLKSDDKAFKEAEAEFNSLYNSSGLGVETPGAIRNTYNDIFDQAQDLLTKYTNDLAAKEVDIWDVVDLVFKAIEGGFNPNLDPEGYVTELSKIMQAQGMTWDEIAHEIELSGYNLDGFLEKYKEVWVGIQKMSFSDWLGFKKDDKALNNSELLKEYESAIGQFKDFLVNDREGKVEIALSDILTVTGDPNGFFKAIGMPNFEDYMKKFGNDTSLAMMAYMSEVGRKVEDTFGDNLSTEGLDHLHEQMQRMMIEATGFDPSFNVHKIEDSYRELVHLSELVKNGYQFSSERMDELIEKYPELKSGIDTVTKSIDKETGEVVSNYTIQQSSIDGLVSEYATLSNEAIDAWRIIKKETLEASIANLNNYLSLEKIFELYHSVVDNQDYRGENVLGEHTGEIAALIKEYEKEMQLLDDMMKNPGTNYFYKPNHGLNDNGDDDSNDDDNKAQLDWLEQYLEKRNRAVDETQKKYEQLRATVIATNDVESDYYDKRAAAMKESNAALQDQMDAYKVAEDEYERRMTSGLLYDNLVKAAKSEGAANDLINKIMAGEDINLEGMESDLQSAITAMVTNWNNKRDAHAKQIEIGVQLKDNSLAQMKEDVERIVSKYDRVIKEYEQRQKALEHYQTMQTSQGLMQNEQYIIALIDNESKELAANIAERDRLTEQLKSFIPTTEDELKHWYDLKGQIDDTTNAIYENQEAIAQWQNEVKKLEWELDDKIMQMKYAVTDEADFLINNLDNSDMYKYMREYLGNDAEKTKLYSGKMSDEGLATLAMRFTKRKAYYEQIKEYDKQIAAAQELYMKDTANTENLDHLNDLETKQREIIQNYNDEKQAILDLVREGYDKQLESLQSLIDKYMEAVNAEKDLYDYQKNMEKQTKNISNLRKQMAAYANDTSEEAKMKLQQLSVQLQEAEEGRSDTEYQRKLQDQQDILDRMYQNLEDYFNDKMEDSDAILKEFKALAQDNIPNIKQTLADSLTFSKTAQASISDTLTNVLDDSIDHVASNLAITDGDVQSVRNSVLVATTELENFYRQNELEKTKKENVYNWINNLNTQAELFNTNLIKLAEKFDSQTTNAMSETEKAERISNVATTATSMLSAGIKAGMSALTTTQGATLEKVANTAAISLSDAMNNNMSLLYDAYNATKSITDAIQTVFKTPSNVTYNLAINLDNVTDYASFINECKKSKQFENLIQTMTLGMMNAGSNSLKKYGI